MNVREAIRLAKAYVQEVFQDEAIAQIGLEELDFREADEAWDVTVGFARSLPPFTGSIGKLSASFGAGGQRVFKVVRINRDGKILSMKHRHVAVSD